MSTAINNVSVQLGNLLSLEIVPSFVQRLFGIQKFCLEISDHRRELQRSVAIHNNHWTKKLHLPLLITV